MSQSAIASQFSDLVIAEPSFNVTKGSLVELKEELIIGDQTAIILIPENFTFIEGSSELSLILDASQVRQASSIQETLENSLLAIERDVRGIKPMFNLVVEDVQARPQRYIDFLLPGILAYMLMNLCIAGSGFNIVEYRRRGILKRLFVTPIQPKDFIVAIILSRMMIVLTQISVMLGLAVLLLDINIIGGVCFSLRHGHSWNCYFSLYWIFLGKHCKNSRSYSTHCCSYFIPTTCSLRGVFSN